MATGRRLVSVPFRGFATPRGRRAGTGGPHLGGLVMWHQLLRSSRRLGVLAVTVTVLAATAPAVSGAPPSQDAAAAVVAQPQTVAPSEPGAVVSVPPARIADSRVAQQITGAVPALGTATVQVTGQGGVPDSGVAAAVLNVTAVAPQAAGFITVWPAGIAWPGTSNLNFQAGQDIPNTVIVPVGTDGKIQLFNGSGGAVHLVVDVTGYTLAGAPTPAPAVSGLAPTGGGTGGGTVVTVTGTDLTGATAVTFGGTAGTDLTVVSGTELTVTSPAHDAGKVDVQVTTPAGTSPTGDADAFTYTAPTTASPAWAWGSGSYGQLGNGCTDNNPVPVPMSKLTGVVTAVAAGGFAGYALLADGTVQAWGYGADGELGNGGPTDSSTPVTGR